MIIAPEKFVKQLKKQNSEIAKYLQSTAPVIVGVEAVNFFKSSFLKGGFTDDTLVKWKSAKRTDKKSKWYGFEYRARTRTPNNHPKRSGFKKGYKARKANPITNFSPAATKRKTLNGYTGDLKESIEYRRMSNGRVRIFSNLDYAKVQNEGGMISILGKKTVKLPKRQFMGESKKLDKIILTELNNDVNNILQS